MQTIENVSIDRELQKVFGSQRWRQVFRAQLAAQVTPAMTAYAGVLRPEQRAKEAVQIADAILAEVGM